MQRLNSIKADDDAHVLGQRRAILLPAASSCAANTSNYCTDGALVPEMFRKWQWREIATVPGNRSVRILLEAAVAHLQSHFHVNYCLQCQHNKIILGACDMHSRHNTP